MAETCSCTLVIVVVFVTIYICTINLFLLFDNTTGMTHFNLYMFVCLFVSSTEKQTNKDTSAGAGPVFIVIAVEC